MKELLLDLIEHMRWADALVAAALSDDAAADPEAVRLFAHIAAAEHLWYSRILEQPPKYAVWPALSTAESRDLAAAHADLFERLTADRSLEESVAYTNSAGRRFRNTIGHIVTHVTAHGSYHRGQIALRIRAAGGVPPYTDFIQFVRRNQDT